MKVLDRCNYTHFFLILLTVILLGLLVLTLFCFLDTHSNVPLEFAVTCGDSMQPLSLWQSDSGLYYCFVPSYADFDSLSIKYYSDNVYIDREILTAEWMKNAEYNREYRLSWNNNDVSFMFLKASPIPTVFVQTKNGSMKYINSDRDKKEKVSITVVDESGFVCYETHQYSDRMSGRGNTTWGLPKKPYCITLDEPTSILGMVASDKWVLLANGFDETHLRNKIIYDLGSQIGLSSPQTCYVDLFANGEYLGLYLLSENIDERYTQQYFGTNICLYESKVNTRWKDDDCTFSTVRGKDFVISCPNVIPNDMKPMLVDKMQQIEDCIFGDGDVPFDRYIDMDSWVRRYLIDEISLNIDAERFSSFYYWDYSDGKSQVKAGPIWDYDLSMGNINSESTVTWDAPNRLLSSYYPWYSQLMCNKNFKENVIRVFENDLCPFLDRIETVIDSTFSFIEKSVLMDDTRWEKLPATFSSTNDAIDHLKGFLKQREQFLNSMWIEKDTYYSVKLLTDTSVFQYCVKNNSVFSDWPHVSVFGYSDKYCWFDVATGKVFDFSKPITEDVELRCQEYDE